MRKLSQFVIMVIVVSLVFTVSCVSKEVPVTETYYETEYKTEYKTETYATTEDVVVKTVEDSNLLSPKSKWRTTWVYLIGSEAKNTYYYGYDISMQEHSRSQVQVSFTLQPQMHKGIIYAIDLTGACYDQSIPFSGLLFGKEPTTGMGPGQIFVPNEGCQVISPQEVGDIRVWIDGFSALARNPARILGTLSVDKRTTDDSSTFDAKGIKEFAIVIGIEPELRPPTVKLTWSDDIIEQKAVAKERQVPYEVPVQVEKQRTVMQTKKIPFWEVWKAEPAAETTSPAPVPPAEELSPPPSPPMTPEVKPPVTSPQLVYEDDFSNPNSGWTQSSAAEGEGYYRDGEFHGLVKMWDWSARQFNRNAGRFKDFIMEEDIRLVSGPKDSAYGLIFRCQDDDNFYRFLISANGSYIIGARLDGKWTELQRWTVSPYINQDNGTNQLKVICKGSQIEVHVNGHHLTTVIDDSFADGYVGGIICGRDYKYVPT